MFGGFILGPLIMFRGFFFGPLIMFGGFAFWTAFIYHEACSVLRLLRVSAFAVSFDLGFSDATPQLCSPGWAGVWLKSGVRVGCI